DAELQPREILDGFDLLSKPSAHLRAGIAGDKTIDVMFLGEFVHEFHAVAIVKPGILQAGVEDERNGTEQCPSRILADIIISRGMTRLDGTVLNGIEDLQGRNDLTCGEDLNLKLVVGGLAHVFGKGLASAVEGVERLRPTCRQPPSDLRHGLRDGRRGQRLSGYPGGSNYDIGV